MDDRRFVTGRRVCGNAVPLERNLPQALPPAREEKQLWADEHRTPFTASSRSPGDSAERLRRPREKVTTHYVAHWSEGNLLIACGHQHKALSEAVACIEYPDGSVKAFSDGRERPLTTEEQSELCRSVLELYLRERELSRRDSKTGALNDRAFREVLSYESKRSRRNQTPVTLVSLDLDGFKDVNDSLGHRTGDLVLKVVAWVMQSTLREQDSVARPGGDEFAVLLPETNAEEAHVVLDKLQTALRDAMQTYDWKVTFSIGVVTFKTPLATPDYMIDVADKAMLSIKKTGKNRVSYLVVD